MARYSLERFLNFINKNAYIQTAIAGNSFCKAAADACLLLIRNCLRVGTLQIVSTVFIFLGKYFIALVVGDALEKSPRDLATERGTMSVYSRFAASLLRAASHSGQLVRPSLSP